MALLYFLRMLHAELKGAWVVFPLAMIVAASFLGVIEPAQSFDGDGTITSRYTYAFKLDQLEARLATDMFDGAPAELMEFFERERVALKETVAAQTLSEFYERAAHYLDILLKESEAGYFICDDVAILSHVTMLKALADRGNAVVAYQNTQKFPGLLYLAWMPGQVSYALFLIPPVVVTALNLRARSGLRLMARVPLATPARSAISVAAAVAGSGLVMGLAWLPVFVVQTIANGWGDPSYPAVFVQDGEVHGSTVGAVVVQSALLYLAIAACIASVAECAFVLSKRAWVGVLCACALPVLALTPVVSSGVPSWMGAWLPTTYFNVWSVTGYASPWFGIDILPVPGVSFGRGCAVLLISTACMLAVAAGVGWKTSYPTLCAKRGDAHV